MPHPTLVVDHKRHHMPAARVISFDAGALRLHVDQPARDLFAVIRASDPISISRSTHCTAELRIGWDGTLGYSLYGLSLNIPQAGEAIVELQIEPPPAAPIKTSPAEVSQFAHVFHRRPSRFPDSPREFAVWQAEYRKKLASILMPGNPPASVPLEVESQNTSNYPTFDLLEFRYRSRADRANTALLSIPKNGTNAARKYPLVVALHGHESKWGGADPAAFTMGHADDFCAYFAERGWAVLHPATMDHTLQREGWTLQGEWTWDAMRALDCALSRADVDAARVATVGLSTGAHLAMNLLALDDRVRAGVVGCVLSTWHHESTRMRVPPHCDCGIFSQLGAHIEECDWAALAAPKAVQFQHGRKDQCFYPGADDAGIDLNWNKGTLPRAEYDVMFSEVLRAWRLAGREHTVETSLHEGAHQVSNEAAHAWLVDALRV